MTDLAQLELRINSLEAVVAARRLTTLRTAGKQTEAGMRSLSATATKLGFSIRGLLTGLAPLVAALIGFQAVVSGLTSIRDFESILAQVRGIAIKTTEAFEDLGQSLERQQRQFDALKKKAFELGATTRFTATEVGEAELFLARAGFSVNGILAALPGTLDLAAAGVIDLGTAADIATNVLSQFNLAGSEMGRVGDIIVNTANSANTNVLQLAEALKLAGPVAAALNIDLEETAAVIGVLGNSGIQASLAGTQLRGIIAALTAPTAQAQKQIDLLARKIGDTSDAFKIVAREGDGSLTPLLRVLKKFNEAVTDPSEIFQIFSRRQAAGAVLLSRYTKQIERLTKANREAAGEAKRLAEVQENTLIGAVRGLKAAVEGLFIALGDSFLLGAMTSVVLQLRDFFRIIGGNVQGVDELTFGLEAMVFAARVLTAALAGIAVVKTLVFFSDLLLKTKAVRAAMLILALDIGKAQKAWLIFSGTIAKHPLGFLILGIAAVAAAFKTFNDRVEHAAFLTDKFKDSLGRLAGISSALGQARAAEKIAIKTNDNDERVDALRRQLDLYKEIREVIVQTADEQGKGIPIQQLGLGKAGGELFQARQRDAVSKIAGSALTKPTGVQKVGFDAGNQLRLAQPPLVGPSILDSIKKELDSGEIQRKAEKLIGEFGIGPQSGQLKIDLLPKFELKAVENEVRPSIEKLFKDTDLAGSLNLDQFVTLTAKAILTKGKPIQEALQQVFASEPLKGPDGFEGSLALPELSEGEVVAQIEKLDALLKELDPEGPFDEAKLSLVLFMEELAEETKLLRAGSRAVEEHTEHLKLLGRAESYGIAITAELEDALLKVVRARFRDVAAIEAQEQAAEAFADSLEEQREAIVDTRAALDTFYGGISDVGLALSDLFLTDKEFRIAQQLRDVEANAALARIELGKLNDAGILPDFQASMDAVDAGVAQAEQMIKDLATGEQIRAIAGNVSGAFGDALTDSLTGNASLSQAAERLGNEVSEALIRGIVVDPIVDQLTTALTGLGAELVGISGSVTAGATAMPAAATLAGQYILDAQVAGAAAMVAGAEISAKILAGASVITAGLRQGGVYSGGAPVTGFRKGGLPGLFQGLSRAPVTAFAAGGVQSNLGRGSSAQIAAQGFVVDRPTLLPQALLGEGARPEAIMPLDKTTQGALGVMASVGGEHRVLPIDRLADGNLGVRVDSFRQGGMPQNSGLTVGNRFPSGQGPSMREERQVVENKITVYVKEPKTRAGARYAGSTIARKISEGLK